MNYDFKSLWKISLPVVVSLLFQQLISITDAVYLGRVSTVALGACALGSTYFFAFFVLIAGFTFGAQIIISRRNGEEAYEKIGAIIYQGSIFLLVCAMALILLSKILSPYILKLMITDQNVLNATFEYVDWRMWGILCSALLMMFRSFFVGIAKTFALQLISVSMVVTNIVLNYALIFGCWFIEPLGIKGAAIASVLSEFLAICVCLLYFKLKIDCAKYGLFKIVYKDFKLLKSILSLSVWTMIQQFVSVFTWFLFFVAVEHLGAQELAIANILKNSAGIPWIVVVAFGATAGTITGNLIGEGRSIEIIKANRAVIKVNTATVLSILSGFALFFYPILRIYTNDLELIRQAVPSYFTALLCYFPLFSGWIWFQAVSATGNTRYSLYIELIAMLFYLFFVATVILYFKAPLYICMLADGLYNLVICITSKKFICSGKWRGKKF